MKPYGRKAKVTNPASRKRMKKRHYSARYLKENPAAAKYTEFEHVLAAEYQDLNKAGQTAVAYLSETAQICIVGDDDQSIYAFSMRGTRASVSGRISIPASSIQGLAAIKTDRLTPNSLASIFPSLWDQLLMPAKTSKRRTTSAAENLPQVDLGWLGGTIGFNLRIAQEASVRTYLRSVADTGTLQWRFAILALINDNPGFTQAALGRAIKRDTSSLTPALDDLCNRGLVTRIRPEHDRRSYELRLTARGKTTMEQLKAKVQAHEEELDRLITKDQRTRLIQTLRQIAAGISPEE